MHDILLVVIASVVTILIRFIPFLIFGRNKNTPQYIIYLGNVLPMAIMGMLVVYCLKGVSLTSFSGFGPELIASLSVVILHIWKRNTLLSILGGTVLYMILVAI